MTHKSLSFLFSGLFITVLLDQAIKFWVIQTIPLETKIPLLPFISLYHVRNSGIAFSFLSSFSHWGIIAFTLIIIVFLLWFWKNIERDKILTHFGIVLILGGAIGNLIDRVRFHYVTDYISFHIDGIFSFAIFNLADTFITLGSIAVLIDEFRILASKKKLSQ
ncbi:signal peptidase II [Bartonella schoenbuchensis]|uniref:Lipoprotein signal peptidase n=2 Tax=Bartonella schoenbuchensis TaxID=165694 RepID=E6YXE8_BARSR|nr:signal peptidase II [Bartonella schoenbuchensis]AQX29967.1 signal peptidase II Aspartic peptidase, MEROPS family A08 [Bartonella schoenbuchensis R1]CBI81536.1 Lipoprotein signal peptidase [Bartonella schoenbuchensis R1]CDP79266.1 lipoprotein signal peptidase [Bartonella schoenbuchensis]